MDQVRRQAFRKAYGKILDLAMIEVFVEAITSLAQYYDRSLRCFMFGDFQLVPTIEEFEAILGCLLGGRKPYLFSRLYPSMAIVAKVVKILAQELDRVKQNRNGVVGIPRKNLEEKAKDLADQREWTSFVDVLALLVFRIVIFPNVDGLVDLAMVDAFLAYHYNKESLVIVVLAYAYDTFDLRCEKSSARIVCCTPALYVWLVSHVFCHESRLVCPLQGHCMCAEKGKTNLEELLAGMVSPMEGRRRWSFVLM